ncbi:FmdE family protein [Angelakisella massiliensis]|uniref:FmdE family protein n=1 Tax=Angelakisella massiliensis TaxID=1871018 RepID=UPI0008F867D8|nr:FmdE family protein [Angelakisella massiliensis]
MNTFEQDLQEAVAFHGHLCGGQMSGVRMARYALRLLGIEEPKKSKRLICYIETDRCITDAIGTVTGCSLGRRTLKWLNYGKMAATFVDLETNKAVRISSNGKHYAPQGADLVEYFSKLTDEDLFNVQWVTVDMAPGDLPGPPCATAVCSQCGESVLDGKHIIRNGRVLCRACADGAYYKPAQD